MRPTKIKTLPNLTKIRMECPFAFTKSRRFDIDTPFGHPVEQLTWQFTRKLRLAEFGEDVGVEAVNAFRSTPGCEGAEKGSVEHPLGMASGKLRPGHLAFRNNVQRALKGDITPLAPLEASLTP